MKTGIIDVGGGFRDIFGAGVMDYCMDKGVEFDYIIGISAGSANMASYLSRQRGRNYMFHMEYVFRKEYASLGNWLRTRNFVDLDYVYGTLCNSDAERPLDYATLAASKAEFYIGACDARTGEPVYFSKDDIRQDHYDVFKASCALPLFCKPYVVNGVPCYDGGICDPVPVQKAFDDGCDRVVLILTRPVDHLRTAKSDAKLGKLLSRRYPEAGQRLLERYKTYNDGVALARRYEAEGKMLILAPDDVCGMKTLTKDREKFEQMYQKGYAAAAKLDDFMARQ